jgi:hypothetical protein
MPFIIENMSGMVNKCITNESILIWQQEKNIDIFTEFYKNIYISRQDIDYYKQSRYD